MTPDTVVRRYLSLDGAVKTIEGRSLRFSLVERFRDTDDHEGTVPATVQGHLDVVIGDYYHRHHQYQQLASHFDETFRELARERPRNLYNDLSDRRSAQRRSSYACCWITGPESMLMWGQYADKTAPGVALETTLGALTRSVDGRGLLIRPIFYREYHVIDGHGFLDDLDLCMQKRIEFKDERELRLLRYDSDHYHAMLSEAPPPELPDHDPLPWDPYLTLARIVISPSASEEREREIRAAIAAAASARAEIRLELSSAHSRAFRPIT